MNQFIHNNLNSVIQGHHCAVRCLAIVWALFAIFLASCDGTNFSATGIGGSSGGGNNPNSSDGETHPDFGQGNVNDPNSIGGISDSSLINIDSGKSIAKLRPAFAVRGAACLTCHANISGTLVTDFGHGDPFYSKSSRDIRTNAHDIEESYYSDRWDSGRSTGWGTVQFSSDSRIVIPRNTGQFHIGGSSFLNVREYLDRTLTSRGAGIQEASSIYIGAPSADTILSRTGFSNSQNKSYQYFPDSGQPQSLSSGILSHSGYVEISGSLDCNGDLVVNTTLLIHSLTLGSESGCRIYATRSVFINGQINYASSNSGNHNLQIVSSRAILIGFDRNSLSFRLHGVIGIAGDSAAPITRAAPNSAQAGQNGRDIVSETGPFANRLVDIGNGSRHFERLMLVAPQVHSRAAGNFSGIIVAEIALLRGRLNSSSFSYSWDPVFEKVEILPRLKTSDYFSIRQ